MRYYASLKATTVSGYNCFGYWGHFHILENLSASLRRVFSEVWFEWISGLFHYDQLSLSTQLSVETQPLRVTFGSKIDSLNTK